MVPRLKEAVTDLTTAQEYEKWATADMIPTIKHKAGAGYYQCYCESNASLLDFLKKGTNICETYNKDKLWGYALTITNVVCVQIVNFIIRKIVPTLVGWVGYDT